ncbi:MAG TPA: SNF2 helicase-associated domain-containing protein [Blastocatellia bacterium]|nr:SNF2 helicase-associated domain-containing protein [Blastocatellia bacterium]
MKFLTRRFENTQERLLADLSRASRFFAPLNQSLKSARPESCELNTQEAYSFLREVVPLLEQCGFGMLVPSWWDRQAGATEAWGIRMKLSPPKDKGRVAGHGLSFYGKHGKKGVEMRNAHPLSRSHQLHIVFGAALAISNTNCGLWTGGFRIYKF